jgi:ribonucleoside-diphosphate reductase alpha chain
VCCLSSLNLEKYDEFKDSTIVRDLITFLDNVLQFFVDNAGDEISRARYSATQERSLGLGAMGYHSYLQKHMIPFEQSGRINKEIFSWMRSEADAQTLILGKDKGEAPDMKGTGRRNAHCLAIAPNANSSMIVGTSPSIEPNKANAYTHRTRAGSHLIKNKYLEKILEEYKMNTPEVWTGIVTNNGSVDHLEFLNDEEKEVFKTAVELDQMRVVELGGQRQVYLDQGQSLNLFFPAGTSKKYVQSVHMRAWETECKGLYYLRTEVSKRAENISEKIKLDKLKDYSDIKKDEEECLACQA